MNFALILFVLSVVTGILYALDVFKFRKQRAADAPSPLWVVWGADFFPVETDAGAQAQSFTVAGLARSHPVGWRACFKSRPRPRP